MTSVSSAVRQTGTTRSPDQQQAPAPPTTDLPPDLSAALDRLTNALAAMSVGDPAPYAAMWLDHPDVTLFGAWGPVERGHDAVTKTFTWVGSRFSGGPLVPRHVVIGFSDDLAYTVGSEQGEVQVDGGEPFLMRLPVTHADFPPTDQRSAH